MKKLFIVGVGMGDAELLTQQAVNALNSCDEIFAFDRIAGLLSSYFPDIKVCAYSELADMVLSSSSQRVGVMVSGDTGFFSASSMLNKKLGSVEIINIPGLSSMQYLAAKLGVSYEGFNCISLHGRNSPERLLSGSAYNEYSFALTGGQNNAGSVLEFLSDKLPPDIEVTAAQQLSMEDERIVTGTAQELSKLSFTDLAVLLLHNKTPQRNCRHFFDSDFTRGSAPMTKQEIRWTSTAYMELNSGDIVYDIGAGTGSVSVEAASFVSNGAVFAVERDETAFLLLKQNVETHRAFNVIPIKGSAPDVLKVLPPPDKVFIGGSGHKLKEIVKTVLEMNPRVLITLNAVTLETLSEATEVFKGMETKVCCINSAVAKPLGGYNLMTANNPVYIISARGREE